MSRVDPSLDAEIIRLYETLSIEKIAERLPCGPTWVRNALIRNGVRLRKRGGTHHFLPQAEVQRTVDLYLHGGPGGLGMFLDEVGAEVGVAATTVWDRLNQAGLKRRSRVENAALKRARQELQ